jgi:PIN domain nuclease of toxin-antitoxin system
MGDDRLSSTARRLVDSPANEVILSVVSIWEITIKWQIGKLSLPEPPRLYIEKRLGQLGIRTLSVTIEHVWGLASLSLYHRDPFDRLLIAQSIAEDLPIVTSDPQFQSYPVQTLW